MRRPGLAELTFVGVGMTCLLLPQWWALSRNTAQRRQEVHVALRTTADTTKATIRSWASEHILRAQKIARSPELVELLAQQAPEANAEKGPGRKARTEFSLLLRSEGFDGYAVLDVSGAVRAAGDPQWLEREPVAIEDGDRRSSAGELIAWDREPQWRPAVLVPLPGDAESERFLALPLDARRALEAILAERALGRTGRTSAFVQGGGWLAASHGAGIPDCDRGPQDVIGLARRSAGDAAETASFNLDGYANCRGETVVGAWDLSAEMGLGLLTEISVEESYGSLFTSRLAFIGFGVMVGGLLLVLVLLQTSDGPVPGVGSSRPARSSAAWGILGVALLATLIAWLSARARHVEAQQERFVTAAQRVQADLVSRLEHQTTAIKAVKGAIDTFPRMRRRQWEKFLSGLDLPTDFPAIACVTVLEAGGTPEPVEAESVQSEPARAEQVCLARSDRHAPGACAACSDPGSQAAFAEASRLARQLDGVAAALLPPSSGRTVPFLAMAPPAAPDGAGRTPVLVVDLAGVLHDLTHHQSFELDAALYSGSEPAAEALLFRSGDSHGSPQPSGEVDPVVRTFAFGGRDWTLVISPAETLAAPIAQNYPAQVLLAGLAISVLLFDIALVLASTRSRALAIAELMTQRFQDCEVRIRAVLESASDGIVSFSPNGVIRTFNPGAEKLFGYSVQEVVHQRISDLLPDLDIDSGQPFQQLDRDAARKDGAVFPAEVTITRMEIEGRHSYTAIVRDVSARCEAQEQLQESEERYALAARGANDGLWDWNLKTSHIYYSARWRSMIGVEDADLSSSPDEWLGRVHSEDVVTLRRRLADHLEGRMPHFECEYRIQHANGGYRWMLSRGIAVRDENATATRIAGSQTDITDRKRAERQLLYDALHDPLTGLPNRTYFMGRVEQARVEATRNVNRMFGLLFLDIDRFKVVNDSLGHFVGDQLLVAAAERLKACLRPGDTICRLGGDEFAILVEQIDGVTDATRIAERIQRELERPMRVGDREIFAAVSIGIALSSTGKQTADELLRDADLAMYRAKSRGKARYELFTPRLHTRAVELLQLETDLRHAVERNELVLHYQPIVDLATGAIHSVEALIRWNHPQKGLVPPSDFIGVAEESGAIIQITRWLLEAACNQRRAWIEAGLPPLRVSVNISPRQLLQQDLYNLVTETLSAYGQPPEALQLELTESALMESSDATVAPLRELYERGVRISLDDFGTGYSSLIYLQRFPIHNIKIDQSFVRSIPDDAGNAAIASGLIALAHSLNLRVVAEGVETIAQLRFLREKGCDEIQGYLVSPPLPADQLALLLQRRVDLDAVDASAVVLPMEAL